MCCLVLSRKYSIEGQALVTIPSLMATIKRDVNNQPVSIKARCDWSFDLSSTFSFLD